MTRSRRRYSCGTGSCRGRSGGGTTRARFDAGRAGRPGGAGGRGMERSACGRLDGSRAIRQFARRRAGQNPGGVLSDRVVRGGRASVSEGAGVCVADLPPDPRLCAIWRSAFVCAICHPLLFLLYHLLPSPFPPPERSAASAPYGQSRAELAAPGSFGDGRGRIGRTRLLS